MILDNVPPPRLPDPTGQYTPTYVQTLLNVLRLYFNRLSNALGLLIGPNGGQYIDCPNGLFFNTATQSLTAINTAHTIQVPTTYLGNAVLVDTMSPSRIYVTVGGVYNFQFSGQLHSTSGSTKQVWVWIRRDLATIGYSTHQYTLSGSGQRMEAGWNFNIDMQAGQYVELLWAADSTDMTLEATAAAGPHPGIPSAVIAVNFIAPLPDPLPVPP